MNNNGYDNNPFNEDNDNDYLFKMVTQKGKRKTYGWSVASMVCGIISVVCCCTGYAGLVLGLLAIVFAVISRKNLGYFDGMAIAGLVLGIIGLVFGVALIIASYAIDDELIEQYLEEFMREYENQLPNGGTTDPDV